MDLPVNEYILFTITLISQKNRSDLMLEIME
jgi:hypothetical protein